MKEMKTFEYMEIKSMAFICCALAGEMYSQIDKFSGPIEAREWLQKQVEQFIDKAWNKPGKQVIHE
jgi:hypothetical protein